MMLHWDRSTTYTGAGLGCAISGTEGMVKPITTGGVIRAKKELHQRVCHKLSSLNAAKCYTGIIISLLAEACSMVSTNITPETGYQSKFWRAYGCPKCHLSMTRVINE